MASDERVPIPDAARLVDTVLTRSTGKDSLLHGEGHWRRVAAAGLALLPETPDADPAVVFLFALFHDSMRLNDGHDPQHGPRGAALAGELRGGGFDLEDIEMGVAAFLRRFEVDLGGRFTLLLQPSEEGSRGARAMAEKGWLDDADYFFAGHLGTSVNDLGVVAATTVGFLPITKMDVRFRGRAAHAGLEPQEGRNALLAAATAALHLHAIPRHGEGETRINVGTLSAGTGRNVVPDRAEMQVETRGATEALDAYVADQARRTVGASAEMHGVEAEVEVVGRGVGAACDPVWRNLIGAACEGAGFVRCVVPEASIGGSEDATIMMERVQRRGGKATYVLFGSPLAAGHHNPAFDWDEDALLVAVEATARVIRRLCAL